MTSYTVMIVIVLGGKIKHWLNKVCNWGLAYGNAITQEKKESRRFLSDFSKQEEERPLILLRVCKPLRSCLRLQENRLLNCHLGLHGSDGQKSKDLLRLCEVIIEWSGWWSDTRAIVFVRCAVTNSQPFLLSTMRMWFLAKSQLCTGKRASYHFYFV